MTGWQEHTVDLDGRVRVIDYGGAGPRTFICVHGLGGWALDWQLLAPQLTDHGRADPTNDLPAALRVDRAPGRRIGQRRAFAQVAAPALVVHGAYDRLVSARSGLHLARSRPDWSVNVLPGIGHIAQLEAPQRVASLITEWLGEAVVESSMSEEPEVLER
jgi:pimeloyl-ACP methyl ester carboxylesterase